MLQSTFLEKKHIAKIFKFDADMHNYK